jgi:hypothetical protein
LEEINSLDAELNPICHLLALLGAHPILHVSRIRVKERGAGPILHREAKGVILVTALAVEILQFKSN